MLGIAGVILCGVIVSTLAVLLGNRALNKCQGIVAINDEELRNIVKNSIFASFEPSWAKRIIFGIAPFIVFAVADSSLSYLAVPWLVHALIIAALAPLIVAIEVRLLRKELDRFIWRRLAERGVPMCIHCGYDLRGQTVCTCPECGKPFDPKRLTIKKGAFYALDIWREQQ